MGSHLTIFDASSFVYTGMNSPSYSRYRVSGFPVGGIRYLLRYLCLSLGNMSDVIIAFDSKSFRKDLLGGYKSNREGNPEVYAQLEFLYEELSRCGIPCYKEEGFEADDIVYNAVNQNRDKYARISIHSSDYDLTHNVDTTVYFEAANSIVNNINYSNFKNSIVKGKNLMLNTISAYKAFCGDSSDSIPPFTSENGMTGTDLYYKFCEYLNANLDPTKPGFIDITRNIKALLIFLESQSESLTEKDKETLKLRAQVVYPAEIPSKVFEGKGMLQINTEVMSYTLSAVGEYAALKQIKETKKTTLDSKLEYFQKRAKELRTGEYAVDKGLEIDNSDIDYEILNMRSF